MKYPFILFLVAIALLWVATVIRASAESICTPDGKQLITGIEATGQKLVGYGIHATGVFVQIFGKDGGEWTVVYTRPDSGETCFGGIGSDWQTVVPEVPGKPS